jgi:hypothetical protein
VKNVHFEKPHDERSQSIGLLLVGASLFSLIEDDLWRFQSTILELMANHLQTKIDDYETRKRAKATEGPSF